MVRVSVVIKMIKSTGKGPTVSPSPRMIYSAITLGYASISSQQVHYIRMRLQGDVVALAFPYEEVENEEEDYKKVFFHNGSLLFS